MLRAAFALLSGMLMLPPAHAQPMPEAAMQLAARISSLLPRRATVWLDFQDRSSLAPGEFSTFRAALEQELKRAGLEIAAAAAQPESHLRITVSENTRGLLFVAAFGNGENPQVVMLPWNAPPASEPRPRVRIMKQAISEQSEPVLDILLLDSGNQLLVLSPGQVSRFHLVNGQWTADGVAAVTLARPIPRDPRGRMEILPSGLHLYVSGSSCAGALQPEFRLTCAPGNDTWPLNARDPALAVRWVADRNLLESDAARGPFYSAAAGWFAAANGRIQDRAGDPIPGADGWGSDLVSIENSCGIAATVLAAKAGDSPDQDQVQAYEMANGQAVPAGEPLTLPGAVTALWPAEIPGQATLVIRNSKTGRYEASRLGLACAE